MKPGLTTGLISLAMLYMSGCSMFSGAASMTINVDVYKGPLSQHYYMQRGELIGLLEELKIKSGVFAANIATAVDALGYGVVKPALAKADDNKSDSETVYTIYCEHNKSKLLIRCIVAKQIVRDANEIIQLATEVLAVLKNDGSQKKENESADSNDERQGNGITKKELQAIGALVVRTKGKAIYWSESLVTAANQSRLTRMAIVSFANLLAEFGNQIGVTADALAKRSGMYDIVKQSLSETWCIEKSDNQKKNQGQEEREEQAKGEKNCDKLNAHEASFRSADLLSPSVFLRDSKPTAFINLYTWNRAGSPDPWENILLHPIESFTSESTANRVRGTEQVFEDRYWSRINSVYASGRGDASMAFVRSGEGNWGLKSFSNDPGQLLSSYTTLITSTVKSVAETLAKGTVPGADIMQQLNAMVGGSLVATGNEAVSPEDIQALNVLMKQKLRLFKAEAARLDESQATDDDERTAFLAEIEASLNAEAETLMRMATRLKESQENVPATETPTN